MHRLPNHGPSHPGSDCCFARNAHRKPNLKLVVAQEVSSRRTVHSVPAGFIRLLSSQNQGKIQPSILSGLRERRAFREAQ